MIRRISIVALFTIAGWANTSSAALIGACTFAGGCGPDFNVSTSLAVDYAYNASTDTGVFSITSNVTDASFLAGQLDDAWVNTAYGTSSPNAGNPYGRSSLNVIPSSVNGNDNFTLNFSVDGSGNLKGGSDITMNGRVVVYDKDAGGLIIAPSYNGTLLDGSFITGGTIDQIGWNNTALDFFGSINGSSLLTTAGFGSGVSGILSMGSSISSTTGNIEWSESWTAGGTLDVVVPVPAAVWLFASGLITLLTVSRRKS